MTGHTLGAAGALEAAFCWLSLTKRDVRAVTLARLALLPGQLLWGVWVTVQKTAVLFH